MVMSKKERLVQSALRNSKNFSSRLKAIAYYEYILKNNPNMNKSTKDLNKTILRRLKKR